MSRALSRIDFLVKAEASMTPKRFSSADHVIKHCSDDTAIRDVVTDLHRDPPRIYLVCSDRTFMITPETLATLARSNVIPLPYVTHFVEIGLLPPAP